MKRVLQNRMTKDHFPGPLGGRKTAKALAPLWESWAHTEPMRTQLWKPAEAEDYASWFLNPEWPQ